MLSLWKKVFHIGVIAVLLIALIVSQQIHVKAESCDGQSGSTLYDCLDRAIDDYIKQKEESVKATTPLESEVAKLKKQLAGIQAQISSLGVQIKELEAGIKDRDEKIKSQYVILAAKVRDLYKKSSQNSPFLIFVSSNSAAELTRGLAYKSAANDEDKNLIVSITKDILALEADKKKIETDKVRLAGLQAKIDTQKAFFEKEIAGAKKWQAELSGRIAELSAKQQSFLAAKLGGLNIPLFAVAGGGCSSDLTNGKNPGFSGGFGFFTFGVPNRVGLNQYGAWGRSKAGKSYDEILRAYYNFDGYQDMNATIKVNNGDGINRGSVIWSGSLEDYVKRIYEVPNEWGDQGGMEALKAQAVAVRSYVLAATDNGNSSICATQACQVFKTSAKGGNWENAVSSTTGKTMIQGGKPIKAYFSSTHGGYVFNTGDLKGWSHTSFTKRLVDTPSGVASSLNDIRNNSYDKDSPWLYCDWGARSQYGGTAWLKSEEVADIVNVMLLVKQDGSTHPHLYQVDKPNPEGTDTWNMDTVKQKLGGSAYNSVDNISVNIDFSSGRTTSITFSGSGHNDIFSGDDFRSYFTLRAPANIQIVGPLFNVERK